MKLVMIMKKQAAARLAGCAAFAASIALLSPSAQALDVEARGVGTAAIGKDINSVRTLALREAKRNAVSAALNKTVGAGTSNSPSVQQKLDDLVVQIGDDDFYDVTPSSADGQYSVSVTLRIDDKTLRSEISDLGLALNTNTVRNQPILVMMDEFYTTPTNLHAPLEELTEFRHEAGSHYNDKQASAHSSSAAYAASSDAAYSSKGKTAYAVDDASASRLNASYDTQQAAAARDGAGNHAEMATSDSGSIDAASASTHQASGITSHDDAAVSSSKVMAAASSHSASARQINAEDHDNTYYKKLIKYQPQNTGPDSKNYTYNELKGQLGDLDLNVLDNGMFRSKYFGNHPITLDQLENGAELAKYVDFARTDATADYLMIGSSVIYDLGIDKSSGQESCTGVASVKTFSTKTSQDIGSATESETAIGISSDDCRARLAVKLADSLGEQVGQRIQEYVKKRTMYGTQYTIRLTGGNLNLMTRAAFNRALGSVAGIEGVSQRQASATLLEIVASYRGTDPLDQAVATALSSNPVFANLDSTVDGNVVTLCMNGCTKPTAVR